MMCHSMGRPPISTMGLGLREVSSVILEPKPPARMTAFIVVPCDQQTWMLACSIGGGQCTLVPDMLAISPSSCKRLEPCRDRESIDLATLFTTNTALSECSP